MKKMNLKVSALAIALAMALASCSGGVSTPTSSNQPTTTTPVIINPTPTPTPTPAPVVSTTTANEVGFVSFKDGSILVTGLGKTSFTDSLNRATVAWKTKVYGVVEIASFDSKAINDKTFATSVVKFITSLGPVQGYVTDAGAIVIVSMNTAGLPSLDDGTKYIVAELVGRPNDGAYPVPELTGQ